MSLVYLHLYTRAPAQLDQSPTLMTSFNLNYFLKGPISKYIHVGLGLQHVNLVVGGTMQSITPRVYFTFAFEKVTIEQYNVFLLGPLNFHIICFCNLWDGSVCGGSLC